MSSGSNPIKVMLNASHAVAGGGLVYLESILPALARAEGIEWVLVAPAATLARLNLPASWTQRAAPELGFAGLHLWEQAVLPFWAHGQGVAVMLCNANYVPLLARRPIPILHSPVSDGLAQAATWRDRLYWTALKSLTALSLRRSTLALTTAEHLIDDYGAGRSLRRDGRWRFTPPGVPLLPPDVAKDPDLVVAVGDVHRHKDYPTLVRAFALVLQRRPQVRLEIIGRPLDRSETDALQALIAELGVERSVALTGFLPHDQTLGRMAQATALVSASRAETSNMVVVEAMAVGTPAILPDLRFQRQLAENVAVFVSETGDREDGFANAILSVLDDPARQQRMREAGQDRAAAFDWAKTASTIIDAIRLVAAR
jgi:glycosyltransferase involved in cell wall biosynthesis